MRGAVPVSKLKKKMVSALSVILVLSSLFVMVAQAYTVELNNGTDKITYNYPDNTTEESRKSLKTFLPEFENLGDGKTIDQPLTVANQSANPLECKLRLSFDEETENTTAPDKLLVLWQKAKAFYQISITAEDGTVLYDSKNDQQAEEATWRDMDLGVLPGGASQTFQLHVAVNGSDAAYDDSKNKLELSLITKIADPAAVTPVPSATAIATATPVATTTAQPTVGPSASAPAATSTPVLVTATPMATHKSSMVKVTATPKVTTKPKATATATPKAGAGKTTPKTGDETPIVGVSILAAAALGVFVFLSIKNKKKN